MLKKKFLTVTIVLKPTPLIWYSDDPNFCGQDVEGCPFESLGPEAKADALLRASDPHGYLKPYRSQIDLP